MCGKNSVEQSGMEMLIIYQYYNVIGPTFDTYISSYRLQLEYIFCLLLNFACFFSVLIEKKHIRIC